MRKRTNSSLPEILPNVTKQPRLPSSLDPTEPHPKEPVRTEPGSVLAQYYPSQISISQAEAYRDNKLMRPFKSLLSVLSVTKPRRAQIKVEGAVVYWFKYDLRVRDNMSLHLASQLAHRNNVPLLKMYIISPQDFEAHSTAPARVDFILRTLHILQVELDCLDIPLFVQTVKGRTHIPGWLQQCVTGELATCLQIWSMRRTN
jgi:deoxyribodipyrimidine photo-lyase